MYNFLTLFFEIYIIKTPLLYNYKIILPFLQAIFSAQHMGESYKTCQEHVWVIFYPKIKIILYMFIENEGYFLSLRNFYALVITLYFVFMKI